ncbi:MAG: hypothetical protein L3J59_12580 [Methylococcaceae bacterium]|nr:hypothetical protein [Methylococcaceae bacterium]
MKLILIGTTLILSFLSTSSLSTEYIYRDLMANTLPSAKCEIQSKAEETARKPYKMKRYSKRFCQTQGYGWGLEEITKNGKIACNECTSNKSLKKCYIKDVIVKCKRIKLGTVGMLPGQG